MLRARLPGPYEDRVGPVVLTALLIVSIVVNMSMKMIDIFDAKRTSSSSWVDEWMNVDVDTHQSPSDAHWSNPHPPPHDTETGRAPIVAPSMKGALKHPVMVHASGPV